MTRPTRSFLALLLTLHAPALLAQQPADSLFVRRSPALVKYGKWVVLAGAIGMGLKASSAHHAADDSYDRLSRYCDVDITRCNTTAGGKYVDPVSERYYQSALRSDRRARGWLVGGEAALLGAAGLFVWELTRPKERPRNIPFEPTVSMVGPATLLGLRFAF